MLPLVWVHDLGQVRVELNRRLVVRFQLSFVSALQVIQHNRNWTLIAFVTLSRGIRGYVYLDAADTVAVVVSFLQNSAKPIRTVQDGVRLTLSVDENQSIDNLSEMTREALPPQSHLSIFVYYAIYSQVVLIPVRFKNGSIFNCNYFLFETNFVLILYYNYLYIESLRPSRLY